MQSVIGPMRFAAFALFKKIWWHNSCHTIKHHSHFNEIWSTPRSSLNLVKITVILYYVARFMSPDFFKKCQIQPISEDQWQIANITSKFISSRPIHMIFDSIRISWIFWRSYLLKSFKDKLLILLSIWNLKIMHL